MNDTRRQKSSIKIYVIKCTIIIILIIDNDYIYLEKQTTPASRQTNDLMTDIHSNTTVSPSLMNTKQNRSVTRNCDL